MYIDHLYFILQYHTKCRGLLHQCLRIVSRHMGAHYRNGSQYRAFGIIGLLVGITWRPFRSVSQLASNRFFVETLFSVPIRNRGIYKRIHSYLWKEFGLRNTDPFSLGLFFPAYSDRSDKVLSQPRFVLRTLFRRVFCVLSHGFIFR